MCTSSDNPRINTNIIVGIPDTASTKHYITKDVLEFCSDVEATKGPKVAVANGRIIVPTKKAQLPLLDMITRKAKVAFSFDSLQSGFLISIGQLCDDDCIAIFSQYDVQTIKNNQALIKGRRTDNNLWSIPLTPKAPQHKTTTANPDTKDENPTTSQAYGVIQVDATKGELAQHYAATLFNPVETTLLRSIKNKHFTSWPGLATRLIKNIYLNEWQQHKATWTRSSKICVLLRQKDQIKYRI